MGSYGRSNRGRRDCTYSRGAYRRPCIQDWRNTRRPAAVRRDQLAPASTERGSFIILNDDEGPRFGVQRGRRLHGGVKQRAHRSISSTKARSVDVGVVPEWRAVRTADRTRDRGSIRNGVRRSDSFGFVVLGGLVHAPRGDFRQIDVPALGSRLRRLCYSKTLAVAWLATHCQRPSRLTNTSVNRVSPRAAAPCVVPFVALRPVTTATSP